MSFIANINGNKSHKIVLDALTILENMEHHGAIGAENNTGDGAGIMIQMPHNFFVEECLKLDIHLPEFGKYGVGVIFFPKDPHLIEEARQLFNRCADELNLKILCYRKVPVNDAGIGFMALSVEPHMEQVFIKCPNHINDKDQFERKLFVLRNYASHLINAAIGKNEVGFYIASLSYKTVVYKGQLNSTQLRKYFRDLTNKKLVSAFGLIHLRFATNSFPSWKLAQPFRYIAHKGEINTLQGNLNSLRSTDKSFTSPYFSYEEMNLLLPIMTEGQSDSACLDNMIELLTLCGRSLPHVLMMLMPEAWNQDDKMDPTKRAFYEFHSAFMEPWDGAAFITFSDGNIIGAMLDRNGLRPSCYCITSDDRIIVSPETGVLPVDPSLIIEKGRLPPGKMFILDLDQGRIIDDNELKQNICSQQPYADWLNKYKIRLEELPNPRVIFSNLKHDQIFKYQKAFGYTSEDLDLIIAPMAATGKEPIGSMGLDIPLAILSDQPQHLSSYFMQLFAQVTNCPIDPIRERIVMSLNTFVGNIGNILVENPLACHSVSLIQPVLTDYQLEQIRSIDTGMFQAKTLQCYFRADGKPGSLEVGLKRLCRFAEDAINDDFKVLILQDRAIDSEHAAIPSLLATSAVHHHLIRKGLRGGAGIIAEAGDIWEVHHFACLIGFGATAINPYLALATISDMKETDKLSQDISDEDLKKNYIKAVNDGLLKVFSKMGISTLQSYQGAQIFEILGINKKVVDEYFTGAISRIEGLGLDEIAKEILTKHFYAFSWQQNLVERLPVGGVYQWRERGEFHLFNPTTIHLLQYSTRKNDYNLFKKYSAAIDQQSEKACTFRSLFQFKKNMPSISIDEVEPAEDIYKRFATGAMSFGSVSWEAHTTLAVAMNRLGAKSNTGEGGEDDIRYSPLPNGDSMRSAIKQIASARFGVTNYYLTEADELQIKIGQGSDPGEGGYLPDYKVDEWIGRIRNATPGVGLISPPSNHDVYSSEDLAQLIFDLKNANRNAKVSVKLVSEAGVGTIATAVTKGKADIVLIAGFDGGTGASPLSSIRHAGLPWELGLAETHQALVKNKLRDRVVIQADGQMKTGRDIAIAALLGAEEWSISTAALVVEGCIMMRKCHLNTCPVGIATQDETLRKTFTGDPEHIINFFKFITQELREIMAELGFRTVNEMVGQANFLEMRDNIAQWKLKLIDASVVLHKAQSPLNDPVYCRKSQHDVLENVLDWKLLEKAQPAIYNKEKVYAEFQIKNTDRATGSILSNEITKVHKAAGLPADTIYYKFRGNAGQSFGAFNTRGVTLELEGDANDYFGKGLSGAKLIIYPPQNATYIPEENIIIGNVALYGATDGEVYIRGQAGERFCIRNSGASVVVEGVGDHGCEYMTGGTAVILGKTGINFAAGMSGGIAYVYDVGGNFPGNCNMEMIDLDPLLEEDEALLKDFVYKHYAATGSTVAKFFLEDFNTQVKNFIKVFPKDYKRVLSYRKSQVQIEND